MKDRIAVETLTLKEVALLFKESFNIAYPKSKGAIEQQLKKIKRAKLTSHRWIKTYEEFQGAKFSFYCDKIPSQDRPIVSIGMTHRTIKGMILVQMDFSNGGLSTNSNGINGWRDWVSIYTGHFCERYAQRIMHVENPTFQIGCEGIMFADMLGPVRVTDTLAEGIEEIEFQFKEGQAYGYRDSKSKITYYRTVYSNDMLKGERLDFKKEWEQPLEELYELFKW